MPTKKSFFPALAYLPLDILINHIFTRLPVRSLSRCRCVCKQWLRLLTDPEFIAIHFRHQKIRNHQTILCGPIWYKWDCPGDSDEDYIAKVEAFHGVFYSLHLQQSSSAAAATVDAVRLPGFPLNLKNYRISKPLGYCNGMVCLLVYYDLEVDYSKSRRLLFGNPSTGDYKILPDPISHPLLIGFGCDSDSSLVHDYKCVVVDDLTRNPHIFSLRLNSWRTNLASSDNFAIKPRKTDYLNVGIALDRCIYWLVESSDIIVEFDLKDEEFRELPLPCNRQRNTPNARLSVKVGVGEFLCIIHVLKNNEVNMWSMLKREENKSKEKQCCWSKLMTVTLSLTDFGRSFDIHPLCFMKDGRVLCCVQHSLEEISFVMIDRKTKRVEDFTICEEIGDYSLKHFTFKASHMTYIESLVSPNSLLRLV